MKKAFTFIAAAMLFSSNVHADQKEKDTEHCPQLDKITEVGTGVYRASGNNGEWIGTTQDALLKSNKIHSFNSASILQEKSSSPMKFQNCSYNLGRGKQVQLRFTLNNSQDYTVKTVGKHWQKGPGPFGLTEYFCENTSPENCEFTIVK
ncbi:TPA: DUF3757 domain-containing protein [Salmonella enterica]|nr:DUF3757 domain-containing protein [Salmonella enterica]